LDDKKFVEDIMKKGQAIHDKAIAIEGEVLKLIDSKI
jgi:hypothetical protein